MGFAEYGIKYNIVFTENEGLFILNNVDATKNGIKQAWNDIYQFMLDDFKTNNDKEYNHILDLVNHAGLDDNLYDSMLYDKVIEHMSNNKELSIEVFKEKMAKHNVNVTHMKP